MADLDITHPAIFDYLEKTLVEPDPILREMGDYGRGRGFPIIGAQAGRLLHFLARTINARRVLELGSGFGYSAMWFALAVGAGGQVVMTESDPANVERARQYFARAGLLDRVALKVGDALEIASRSDGPFDLIFCDMHKRDYPKALAVARAKLRVGGVLVYDNMLWHGRVLDQDDEDTRAVRETTRLLLEADDFFTTIVPIRDGQTLSLRLR